VGGSKAIAWLQTETGARVFFNTLVPFQDGLIKYGVIATRDLIADLLG
jgi:translocator assembly and maintenance protein 41